MKKLILLLAASVSLTAFADDEREAKRDQPEKRESPSLRLPAKDGESPAARKERLLDLLKKRREATEAARHRDGDREPVRGARPERAREGHPTPGREHARETVRKPGGERDEHARHERELQERHERAARAERGRMSGEHHPRAMNAEEAERRMHHLREAAGLLAAVGKGDEAEKLEREAMAIGQQLRQHHREREGGHGPSNAELGEAVQQLQKQIQELHRAIKEIHERLAQKR